MHDVSVCGYTKMLAEDLLLSQAPEDGSIFRSPIKLDVYPLYEQYPSGRFRGAISLFEISRVLYGENDLM